MRRPTVLLADDHVVFTDGIVRILKEHFDVVGTVTDGGALLEAATGSVRTSSCPTSRCRR